MIAVFTFSAEWLVTGMMIGEILRRVEQWGTAYAYA